MNDLGHGFESYKVGFEDGERLAAEAFLRLIELADAPLVSRTSIEYSVYDETTIRNMAIEKEIKTAYDHYYIMSKH
jgi:hypothetical protein